MIAFASRTGNVRYVVKKLGLPAVDIAETKTVEAPFLLMTYTDGLGEVPALVRQFMERNGAYCRGVVASGNSNFGPRHFGAAGDEIARRWGVPLVRKLELRGYPEDYAAIRRYYGQCFGEGVPADEIKVLS